MVTMVICDSCGLETDIDRSTKCSNCGATVNLNSSSAQEKIIPPSWGVLMVSAEELSAMEKQEFLDAFKDIWSRVESSLLSTLLPSQNKILSPTEIRYELLCHSSAAYKVEQEIKALGLKFRLNIKFMEIQDEEFGKRLKELKLK